MAEGTLPVVDELAAPQASQSPAPTLRMVDEYVLPDVSRPVRWAGVLFAGCAAVLVPWTVYLAYTLPAQAVSANYNVAWAGFDVLLLVGITWTGFAALHCSRWLGMASSATAALLLVDAWTDVVTAATPSDRLVALLLAALVELPLLAVCGWLSVHAADIAEKRLQLLLRLDTAAVAARLQRLQQARATALSRRRRP